MEKYIQELKTDDNYSSNYSTGERDSQGSYLVADTQTKDIPVIETTETQEIPVIENTGEILIDKSSSGRVRDWDEKKKMNEKLSEILKVFHNKYPELLSLNRLNQITDCASYLKYGITEEGRKKLTEANFCRFRFCPVCVWRKSLKMYR